MRSACPSRSSHTTWTTTVTESSAYIPDIAPAVRVGAGGSAFVLDADTSESDKVDVTPAARLWVSLLVGEADPYDVLDAVEETVALSTPSVAGQSAALSVACLLNIESAPVEEAALSVWLSEADLKQLQNYGTEVGQRLLDNRPSTEIVRLLDRLQAGGTLDLDAHDIRVRLFDAEVRDVLDGRPLPPDSLPPVAIDSLARHDALNGWTRALQEADPSTFGALLHLAHRHGLEPDFDGVRDHVRAFVDDLVTSPHPDFSNSETNHWVFQQEIFF